MMHVTSTRDLSERSHQVASSSSVAICEVLLTSANALLWVKLRAKANRRPHRAQMRKDRPRARRSSVVSRPAEHLYKVATARYVTSHLARKKHVSDYRCSFLSQMALRHKHSAQCIRYAARSCTAETPASRSRRRFDRDSIEHPVRIQYRLVTFRRTCFEPSDMVAVVIVSHRRRKYCTEAT
jgi:hypothetical protein